MDREEKTLGVLASLETMIMAGMKRVVETRITSNLIEGIEGVTFHK